MITSIPLETIEQQLLRQLSSFFFLSEEDIGLIKFKMKRVISRCEYCFSHTVNKYYSYNGETFFNPYQSAQYTIFLYYFANTISYETGNQLLADKLYYLNKIMNACDLYHEVELPDFFTLDHPVGSVMGRARYGEGFSFSQNCTVGNNRGIYPTLGQNVQMCANSSIIGDCNIGDNVIIGANSGVKDENVPDNCIVFGYSPNLTIEQKKMKNIAIIPARGGSKRIPRKNIKPFMGKPIIAYSIEAALQSELFDEVMVSTDDDEIANIAQQYGAKVPFMRSADTANDYATTSDVINEVISYYHERNQAFDIISCIYATAPFITKDILKKAYQEMQESRYDSIFPIVAFSYPIQRSLILDSFKRVKMREPQFVNSRSQDLQTIYHDAGQFYIATWQSFCKYNDFWGENTGAMILNELEVQDLDTEIDWQLAEMKYQLMKK